MKHIFTVIIVLSTISSYSQRQHALGVSTGYMIMNTPTTSQFSLGSQYQFRYPYNDRLSFITGLGISHHHNKIKQGDTLSSTMINWLVTIPIGVQYLFYKSPVGWLYVEGGAIVGTIPYIQITTVNTNANGSIIYDKNEGFLRSFNAHATLFAGLRFDMRKRLFANVRVSPHPQIRRLMPLDLSHFTYLSIGAGFYLDR